MVDILKWGILDAPDMSGIRRLAARKFAKADPMYGQPDSGSPDGLNISRKIAGLPSKSPTEVAPKNWTRGLAPIKIKRGSVPCVRTARL